MGRLRTLVAIGILILGVASTALSSTPAGAATGLTGDEGVFVSSINRARAARGLPALAVHDRLIVLGRWWSARMASAGDISHNPNLEAMVPSGWTAIGENVAMAPTAAGAATALLNSPPHFENMVNADYTAVGIGVARSGGMLFVTEVFYAGDGGSVAPLPAAAGPTIATSSPTPAPAAVASPRPGGARPLVVGDRFNGRTVRLHRGDRLVLRLSTREWRPRATPSGMVRIAGPMFDATACRPRAGAACGATTLTYQVTKPGSFRLLLTRACQTAACRARPRQWVLTALAPR